MGAVFFMLFMFIVFCVSLFLAILNLIFIIVWNVKKRGRRPAKKRWLVIPSVFLAISLAVMLMPVGFVGFLRLANQASQPKIVYAPSGQMLVWPMEGPESARNRFEMNGEKYVGFPDYSSPEYVPFSLDYKEERIGVPIANLKHDPAGSNFFNDFMHRLFSGSTYYEQEISTIYPVENSNGFSLYYVTIGTVDLFFGCNTFCAERDFDAARNYYASLANYDTQTVRCERTVFANDPDVPFRDLKKALALDPEAFGRLLRLEADGTALRRVEIPQKYIDLEQAATPGAPYSGYDERQIYVDSKDGMAYQQAWLALIDGQVYVVAESGWDESDHRYITGYPLPDELNRPVTDVVFGWR